jgi:hypothetical protein
MLRFGRDVRDDDLAAFDPEEIRIDEKDISRRIVRRQNADGRRRLDRELGAGRAQRRRDARRDARCGAARTPADQSKLHCAHPIATGGRKTATASRTYVLGGL